MSRGRGGARGGRGGAIKSFNRDQLSAMGVLSNETLPTLVTQPPPLYPLMERHPVPLTQSLETDYLLILRQDFIDHMQLSASYLRMLESKTNQSEQEIDKLVAQLPSTKEKYDWTLFPAELRPKMLAKRVKKKGGVKKDINIEEKLKALEKQEESKNAPPTKEDEPLEEDEDAEPDEEQDEEMDDGTDYANNYFDNGEGYDDDDDNMDEGPIY